MNTEPHSNPGSSRSRGGLFRRFILPQIIIVAAAGTLGLLWEASQQRSIDKARMAEVASANAAFLDDVRFPQTRQMAENLSVITGSRVGFFLPGKGLVEGWKWSPEERAIASLAKEEELEIVVKNGLKALCQPIADDRGSIVVIEPTRPLLSLTRSFSVVPLLAMTLVAIAAAFLIARSVVGPLQKLASAISTATPGAEMELPKPITRRKDEIGVLARTLINEREALLREQDLRRDAEKMALLGQLATSLAHEIKNPAAAIIMHARSLPEGPARDSGALIRQDAEQITSLVNQWLFVAKPEAPRSSPTDLAAILRSLKERLTPLLDFHRCRVEIDSPDQLIVDGDTQRLEQAFRNLIDNAIKAMPTGGTIRIEFKDEGSDLIRCTIRDEGSGFSEQALERFGETFYSEREGGMGLGLALAKGVFESHGGQLSAENIPGGGARVTAVVSHRSTV